MIMIFHEYFRRGIWASCIFFKHISTIFYSIFNNFICKLQCFPSSFQWWNPRVKSHNRLEMTACRRQPLFATIVQIINAHAFSVSSHSKILRTTLGCFSVKIYWRIRWNGCSPIIFDGFFRASCATGQKWQCKNFSQNAKKVNFGQTDRQTNQQINRHSESHSPRIPPLDWAWRVV